jgi:hypothetical protein
MAESVLKDKASDSGMPFGALLEVYRRGIGAFKTNPSSPAAKGVKSKEQWAYGRVNAFIRKKPTVFTGADNDVRKKYRLK